MRALVRVALFCWLSCKLKAKFFAAVAQLVERVLGKDEVVGSNPISSSFVSRPLVDFKTWLNDKENETGEKEKWPRKNLREQNLT